MVLDRNSTSGFCIVCRNSIFFDQKFTQICCFNCAEKTSNSNLEGNFCHYCGKPTLVSKFKPICNSCGYIMEEKYKKALEINPTASNLWSNLGDVLRYQKKYEEAETAYRKAVDLDPDNITAQKNLGLTWICQKGGCGG